MGDGETAEMGAAVGQHAVVETLPTGWTVSSIVCNHPSSSGNIGTATANFNVFNGNVVTCIFTNENLEAIDASLGTSLSTDGKVTTDIDNGSTDEGNGVGLQSNGKIIIAGTSNNDFAVTRYNSNGTLDTSFGASGIITTDIDTGNNSTDKGNGVAIQTDDKIVVAGRSDSLFALVRYNSNGTLDTNFGTGGIVTDDFSSLGSSFQAAGANAVTIQPDGKIIVVGSVSNSSQFNDFAIMRFESNGALDTSFGTGGKVTTPVKNQEEDRAYAVIVQTDSKIIVVGETKGSPGQFAVVASALRNEVATREKRAYPSDCGYALVFLKLL